MFDDIREQLNETLQSVYGISLNEIIEENPEYIEEEIKSAISMDIELPELAEHIYEVYKELTVIMEHNQREKEDYPFDGLFYIQR